MPMTDADVLKFDLKDQAPFTHIWPHDDEEDEADYISHFTEAKAGSARLGDKDYRVKIGFTKWESAGSNRRRAVVFVNGRPMVVFTGANDFNTPGLMASVIKTDGRQIRDRSRVPDQYDNLRVEPFRVHVDGLRASNGLAVICETSDFRTMIAHALIRFREETEEA